MAILDDNGVPILALSHSSREFVDGKHEAALDPDNDTSLLTGAVVYVQNKRPVGAEDSPDVTVFHIGGETLDEALKSVVGAFDGFHGHDKPGWVASSDEDLARLLAEHYDCKVRDVSKGLKP